MDRVVTTGTERLALGTAQWGSPYGIANRTGPPSSAEVARILDLAADAGIRTLDTARAYGHSEELIGALTNGDRAWRVITKISPTVFVGGTSEREATTRTLDSLESSSRALRRQVLDGVLLHRAAHRHAAGGAIWDRLIEWKTEGRVQKIGVSAATPDEALDAMSDPTVDIIQLAGSLFDQRPIRTGLIRAAREAGTEIFIRSVFLQGAAFLSPSAMPAGLAELREPLARAREWAEPREVSLPTAMIAFAMEMFAPAMILLGCETEAQLNEHLSDLSSRKLTRDEVGELGALVPDLPESVLNPALWES